MTAFLFLTASVIGGYLFLVEFRLHRGSRLGQAASAFVVGTVLTTWLIFLAAKVFRFQYVTVELATLLLVCGVLTALANGARRQRCARSLCRGSWTVGWPLIPLALVALPLLIPGVWKNTAGDWVFKGNYEDISYHLSIVSAFENQSSFPPLNPQSAGAPLRYHYLADFHSAILKVGGLGPYFAIVLPNWLLAISIVILLAEFLQRLLRDRLAAALSGLLLLGGHVGFSNAAFALCGIVPEPLRRANLRTWAGFREILLFPFFNFLDPVVNLFQPQRPFLLGFGVALLILRNLIGLSDRNPRRRAGIAGLLALLPLIHFHSFLFLAPCLVLIVLLRARRDWRAILTLSPLVLAVPQLVCLLTQPTAPGFSGWDVHKLQGGLVEANILGSAALTRATFWLRAGGPPLLLGVLAAAWYLWSSRAVRPRKALLSPVLLAFGAAFFLLINVYRFSPNWGDSNKFYFYFHLALCVPSGLLLAHWLRQGPAARLGGLAVLLACVFPMAIEAAVILSRPASTLFSHCQIEAAAWIRRNTSPNDVFLTGDQVVHFVPALAGRRVVDGAYTWNTGAQVPGVQDEVATIYRTGDAELLRKHKVSYVILGPSERAGYHSQVSAFSRLRLLQQWNCPEGEIDVYSTAFARTVSLVAGSSAMTIPLSRLMPVSHFQAVGTLHLDANFNGGPIVLNGQSYRDGLGVHSRSEIVYQVPSGITMFVADVGLDDTEDGTPGSVVFRVFVDDLLKYQSPVMRWDSPTETIRIPLLGARRIRLDVDDAGDGDKCDHATWASARFE